MTFADKIRIQREKLHLTQQELAEAAGISKRAVAAYEIDNAIARKSTMRKLAVALHVSYDYLLREDITDPEYGIEKMEYIDAAGKKLGQTSADELNDLLEANTKLFAGGDLDEEAKDMFYQAVTKAYLQCKMEARKKFGRKSSGEAPSDSRPLS